MLLSKRILTCFVFLFFSLTICLNVFPSEKIHITFLNPARYDDPFWGLVSSFMLAAADDLSIDLEIVNSERAYYMIRQKGEEIINRTVKPDYLLLANELNTAVDLVKKANAAGIKTMVFNETFLGDDAIEMGNPQEKYTNWLGEYRPDDYQAGYLLAKELIDLSIDHFDIQGDTKLYIAGITGPENNSSSILRVQGLKKAIAEYTNVVLMQVTSAQYDQDKAQLISEGLIKRYPKLNVIWTASDSMALGVSKAIEDSGRFIATGGVDWDLRAIEGLSESKLNVTVGGHFMDGAWALVMLYDYHHGYDFEQLRTKSTFMSLNKDNVQSYLENFGDHNWDKIDFKKYSKLYNKELKKYKFDFNSLLNGNKK